jgi:hypothetical protein
LVKEYVKDGENQFDLSSNQSQIKMWFESDKMYYEAIVKSHKGGDTYDIMWVKEGQEEPMELKEADNTEDVANEDRWSVIEPVYRVCFHNLFSERILCSFVFISLVYPNTSD